MADVQEAQPRLLPECEADHAAELHELRLREVLVEALPQGVVRRAGPDDRLGVRERRLLAVAVGLGRLEVEELVVLSLDEAGRAALLRALVAAVLALDAARHVHPAQLLQGVIHDALAEEVLP